MGKQCIRIGVVGTGFGRYHMDGFGKVDGAYVHAVCDLNEEEARAFADQYGAKYVFTDFRKMAAMDELDAISIAVPNCFHAPIAIEALTRGKHVLVEKPMANTLRDCRRMIRAAEKAGVRLMVGQSRRYYDAVFESRQLLEQGRIGGLIGITALLFAYLEHPPTPWWSSRRKTGGLMIPLWGNHILDYVLWMFGQKPQRVYCEAYSNNRNWEGEDEVSLLVGFSEGRSATIRMSWNTRLREAGEWDGKGKMLSSADIVYERYIQGSSGTLHLNDETRLALNGAVLIDGPQAPSNFALQYREFARAVRENREPLTSGRWAAEIIRIQEAALKSAAGHRVVRL